MKKRARNVGRWGGVTRRGRCRAKMKTMISLAGSPHPQGPLVQPAAHIAEKKREPTGAGEARSERVAAENPGRDQAFDGSAFVQQRTEGLCTGKAA